MVCYSRKVDDHLKSNLQYCTHGRHRHQSSHSFSPGRVALKNVTNRPLAIVSSPFGASKSTRFHAAYHLLHRPFSTQLISPTGRYLNCIVNDGTYMLYLWLQREALASHRLCGNIVTRNSSFPPDATTPFFFSFQHDY